jgi:urease accessory protein
MSRHFRNAAIAMGAALLPLAAQAHPGHATHATFMQGLLHPLSGWDHLLVLLSLGALAAGRSARVVNLCAVLLAVALGGGAALGLAWPAAPFVEPAIMATVAACLVLLVFRRRINVPTLLALCMAFTLIHGVAHGQEAPTGDLAAYFTGFTLAGVALYGAGLLVPGFLARWLATFPARVQKGAPITSRQPGKSPASR